MAAPQVAGMAALVAQYIRQAGLDEKTGLNFRALSQSLMMSTAVPLREEASRGQYWSVLKQGAGLADVAKAISAQSYVLMKEDATASYADGKVKAELGDDYRVTEVFDEPMDQPLLFQFFGAQLRSSFTRSELGDAMQTYERIQEAVSQQGVVMYCPYRMDLEVQ